MRFKTRTKMCGFFWTVLAVFHILQFTAEGRDTKEEKEHSHRKSSRQKDFEHRQQNLARYLQHFLDEYKYLYKMAEDLKHEGRDSNEHRDEIHGMSGNGEEHSGNMNEHDMEQVPMPEHNKHHEHNEHYDEGMNHQYPMHAQDEHHDQRASHEFFTPLLNEQHQLHGNTEKDMDQEYMISRRANAKSAHEEGRVTRSENSGGEGDGDKELDHSGEGEHSGDHAGQTEKGVHQGHDDKHKQSNHREEKETQEMHEIEQMEKEAHKTTNHGDSHRADKETQEMHEIEQMEKEAHKTTNHGDSHRADKETQEMHEIEQMEKEAHKTNNSDGHGGKKAHTTDIHRVDHSNEELIHEAEHSKETHVHSEHSKEFEIEGDIDHEIDEYHDGYHKAYEDEHGEVRYHMDASHDDEDDDDSQGHGDVDSYYANERGRHVRDHDGGDLRHGTARHYKRKKHHNEDLHHADPLGRGKTHQGDTRSDDDLHHGTVDHRERSKPHEKKRRPDRVDSSKHHGKRHLPGQVDSFNHGRKSRHALDNVRIGDVRHRHFSGRDKKKDHNLNDDTHHENADINSHPLNRDDHHMSARNHGDDADNDGTHHSSTEHVKTPGKMEHHKERKTHGESHNIKNKINVPSHQQPKRHIKLERENLHSPHQHHRTRRGSPSHDDDIYIDDKSKKKEMYKVIFTSDDKLHSDDGGAPNEESRKNRGKRDIFDQLKLEERKFLGMKQDSQSHPDCGSVADQSFVYDRDNCRLCQCLNGKAVCEAKPKTCRSGKPENMCPFVNGEMAFEGTPHYDGCNHCVCRKREWVCTRLRCHLAKHDYVNYAALMERTNGIKRHIDTCMECDREPVTPVCGPDWRTYRSLCHLRFCGYYDFDEVIQGPCSRVNPCENVECDVDETCVPFPRGPCLSVKTRDTIPVVCKQYKCVSNKEECSDVTLPGDAVCGQDGHTYPTECHLLKKSIAFAYRGPCRKSCMTGNAQVCGTDGITYQSNCHVNLLNRHVDYPGACENMVAKPEVVNTDDVGSFMYVNRRCRKVLDNKRCLHSTCKTTVIPEGSCCPVCGAAVSIRVDRAIASDLVGLYLLKPSTDFTRLETIQSFIRGIQNPQHLHKCRMTIDYTERNDLSVLFAPRQPSYIPFCQKAAQETMDYINSHSNSSDPIEAMLAAAVAVELGTPPVNELTRVRRAVNLDLVRIKRGGGHLHDMHHMEHDANSTAADVAPPFRMVFSLGAYSLYWILDN